MQEDLREFYFSDKIKEKIQNPLVIKNELKEGKTVQEIIEFSDETMIKFCNAAYLLFEHKKYREAADAFIFLTVLNAHHCEYWLGLGMATQFCQEYESAIDAYELAAMCDVSNPVPYFYLAKCLFAIHDHESALEALDLVIEMADEEEEYAEIKQQALLARNLLL